MNGHYCTTCKTEFKHYSYIFWGTFIVTIVMSVCFEKMMGVNTEGVHYL